MGENQRAFFRIDVVVPTVVRRLDAGGQAWDEFGGETIDLSAGGVLLAGSEPAPEDHLVEVVLRSGEPPLDVTARGRVVRSDRAADGAWLSAVRFERIPSATERELVRFCFQKEAETAKRVSTVRISVAIPVVVERAAGELHPGSTVNLCADGTKIAAPIEVAEGEELNVRFDERWFGRDLILPAQAVRVDKTGADLAFAELTRADRAAINRLVIAEERKQRRVCA
ncbi:MAG TPA: PilZ domain-containing protein [Gaiellales bacterium]|nr:PilZ domain-containing protein [Gaiellales bacterium]